MAENSRLKEELARSLHETQKKAEQDVLRVQQEMTNRLKQERMEILDKAAQDQQALQDHTREAVAELSKKFNDLLATQVVLYEQSEAKRKAQEEELMRNLESRFENLSAPVAQTDPTPAVPSDIKAPVTQPNTVLNPPEVPVNQQAPPERTFKTQQKLFASPVITGKKAPDKTSNLRKEI